MQETSPEPSADKATWRRWFRRRLASVTDRDGQSIALRRHLAAMLGDNPPSIIATFSPLADEPQLLELIATHSHHQWVLPRVDGHHLVFHHVRHLDELERGAFGIREPNADLPVVAIDQVRWFLCPGLGFDRRGARLGRGKGFYDRALETARPESKRIGIAFREQLVAQLPHETHDISMDEIVTADGLLRSDQSPLD